MAVSLGTVTSSNFINQTWNNVYVVVNTISDPLSRGWANWITSAFPQERKGTADVYPLIVIDSGNFTGNNITFTHANRLYNVNIPISVYATRMDTVDGLSSTLAATLNAYRATFDVYGMTNFNIEDTPIAHAIIAGQVVHQKNINITLEEYV